MSPSLKVSTITKVIVNGSPSPTRVPSMPYSRITTSGSAVSWTRTSRSPVQLRARCRHAPGHEPRGEGHLDDDLLGVAVGDVSRGRADNRREEPLDRCQRGVLA